MSDLDNELRRLATDLVGALRDEPVPPAILDLAHKLQAALNKHMAALPAEPE